MSRLLWALTIFNTVAVFLLLLISFQKDFLPIYEYKNWTQNENRRNIEFVNAENKKVYEYSDVIRKTCDENVKKAYDHMDELTKFVNAVEKDYKQVMKNVEAVDARLNKMGY